MGQKTSSLATCPRTILHPDNCTSIEKGSFETNADVAGWGVLIAFAAGAFATLVLCLIVMVKHFIELFTFGCLSVQRRDERGKDATATRRADKVPWIDGVVQDLVLNLSDQQVVTGLALGLSIRYANNLACKVSAYHYNIVANLILMTMCTHVCSIVVLPDYFRNPVLGFVRILGIGAIITFGGLLFVNQHSNANPYPFPTNVPDLHASLNGNNPLSIGLLLPAACYQAMDTSFVSSLESSFKSSGGIGNQLKQSFANGRFKNGYAQWILLTLMYTVGIFTGLIQRVLRINKEDTNTARYTRKFLWWIKLVVIGFAIYVSITTFVYIRSMRQWLDSSKWYEADDYGKNPENDLFTFGQLIPVLLLSLFGIAFLESAHGRWRAWKDSHKSAMPVVPTNPQHKYSYNSSSLA